MARRYNLEQLREQASQGDVTFNVGRLYRSELHEENPEVIDILKTGHASEAANWLASTTPEKMEYGTATREERLHRASGHAALAGIPLQVIAEEHGLEHLIDGHSSGS